MKVQLMGVEQISFEDRESGEKIKGVKLHVVSDSVENNDRMTGKRCASIFTRIDLPDLYVGSDYDLIYDQQLGSNKSRLVDVMACD